MIRFRKASLERDAGTSKVGRRVEASARGGLKRCEAGAVTPPRSVAWRPPTGTPGSGGRPDVHGSPTRHQIEIRLAF